MVALYWKVAAALKFGQCSAHEEMQDQYLFLQHLFQQEFSKMVAVISNLFGLQHIELAEDIVSETFLLATETWGVKGLPKNPAAWLYTVAKQKTLLHFRRDKLLHKKIIPELGVYSEKYTEITEIDFSPRNIRDSQLQMIFAVCSPAIVSEAQIGLALRILCGFGIDEIAEAFLTNRETIHKRLYRAKEKLRTEKVKMELPPGNEMVNRLGNVLHTLYLIFSGGYYSSTQNRVFRKDRCLEAMRLTIMLTEYEITNRPKTNALMALMCFHASRFSARESEENSLILYGEQDEKKWDEVLISQGWHYLNLSASGDELSSYHLEARIASLHCTKEDTQEKWSAILQLYEQLMSVNPSPSVALHRVYALYKSRGPQAALAEADKLKPGHSHFYFLLLGELYKKQDSEKAKDHFQTALALAKTEAEKKVIRKKIELLS